MDGVGESVKAFAILALGAVVLYLILGVLDVSFRQRILMMGLFILLAGVDLAKEIDK